MIQFNLLPDVKQQYVKARRTQRLVALISIGVSGLAIFVLILMILTVDVVQKKSLANLNSDITSKSATLRATPNLNKILTVQNQLNTLTGLHDQKVVSSRLFGYMAQVTPTAVSLNKLAVDFTANTMDAEGSGPSLDSINAFTDTLKRTTYTTDTDKSGNAKAFSGVVLSSFTRDSSKASFTITFSFDPAIFNSSTNVTLVVPNGVSGAQVFGTGS